MPVDSNQCGTQGPRAMYVGGTITNSGATTVTDIVATISGLGSGFFLAGGQPASQSIGALGAGQSTGVYWFIGYGCTMDATTTPTIAFTSSTTPSNTNVTLTARSSISANAGGNVVGSLLGPGAVVGQTIFFDATYSFGGSSIGDEFLLQPSGGQSFDAACFRLVGTEVRASNITPIAVGTLNRLYFLQTQKQSGSGYTATMRYYFEYLCANSSTTARPYALQTSGNALKYTGNFDGSSSVSISFPGATNPFLISKTSDLATAVAGASATVKYTVTVTNPSLNASRISQFVDVLPAGASFLGLDSASDVTAANSSSIPLAGATGTLTFTGRQDVSYLIPALGSVKLIYSVRMPSAAGVYSNSAQALFGTASTPVASAGFTVWTPAPLTIVKSSQALADPVNGVANPKLIPGALVGYTITVSNPHSFAVTPNSIIVVDAVGGLLDLNVVDIAGVGGGPILFQNGFPSSTLTYAFTGLAALADDVDFSNDGGASWTYVPTPGSNGADPAVTHVRIRPKGTMAPGSSFSLLLGYRLP
jgi:uncharacterized repeat protein (TIGR01451 family)